LDIEMGQYHLRDTFTWNVYGLSAQGYYHTCYRDCR